MFEQIDAEDFLNPQDRQIWRQEPENGGRLLPGFAGQLRVNESLYGSIFAAWYGQKEADGLPKIILKNEFWPEEEKAFRKNYPAEIELAYHEVWPGFEADSVELTISILMCRRLKLGSTSIADQLTYFYKLNQTKIDLMMMRFHAATVFEVGGEMDWIDELQIGDASISEKLDLLFFGWRMDDPNRHDLFDNLGEKSIDVGARFFDYFFSGILRNSYAKAKLRIEDDDGEQGSGDSESNGNPKHQKNGGPQP